MAISQEQFQQLLDHQRQQQQELIATLCRRKTVASCTATYDGKKDSKAVDAFICALNLFMRTEEAEEEIILQRLPLILTGEAAEWWQGVKTEINTFNAFETQLRKQFAPRTPAYLIYHELNTIKQGSAETTEEFITRKRMLFSLLPEPKHVEIQQVDMIFGLLRLDVRDKIPRNSVSNFDDLIESARGVEAILGERQGTSRVTTTGRVKCSFCKNPGHTADACRKKNKAEKSTPLISGAKQVQTQAPSPSTPKFSCYGCGTPGFVRSNCPHCTKQSPSIKKENIGFCAVNVQTAPKARPVVFVTINGINGSAYIDTCAKTSVASYSLYRRLLEQGCSFRSEIVQLTLADGVNRKQNILTINVKVTLCGHTFPTTFIVLPEARENKTLLGVGFIQQALMVINLPQYTWHFMGAEDEVYELYTEDFVSFDKRNPSSSLDMPIEGSRSESAVAPISVQMNHAENLKDAFAPVDAYDTPNKDRPSKSREYQLRPIVLGTPKRTKTLFDGYSPQIDYMYRDAQINISQQEVELSPHSMSLFPDHDEIGINSLDIDSLLCGEIDEQQKQQLKDVLKKHEHVFVPNKNPANHVVHKIDTVGKGPISVPPYRLSPPRKEILRKEIDKMMQEGIIEPYNTPWAAPAVLVPKPNGEIRVCVDYRRLNEITVPDTYPIPRLDDLLHEAKPTPFMSTLDLRAGYWQIAVSDDDKLKTGFITPFGIYIFNRMPFGLRNAPATFQRMIDQLKISLEIKLLAYLDDLIVFSATYETHLDDLDKVFQKLGEFNLIVNLRKCKFGCSTVKYLGHYITPKGLEVDKEKTAAILNIPPPNNLHHLVSFLQTCSWYRRFIKDFSAVSEPLTRLTKKGAKWTWTTEQETAFNELKSRLTTPPVLRQADESQPYLIKTDASAYALGAVLLQGEGPEEHPVEYASRLLTSAERNYSTTEREALAVVWAVNKFRGYIEGLPTVVATDHQALRWLMSLKSPTGKLARWALQLQAYDLTIKYVPGRTNVVADMLSRPPRTEDTQDSCDVCTVSVDMPIRSPKEVRNEQTKDETIANVISVLEHPDNSENAKYWSNKGYYVNNGLLYRLAPDSDSEDAQLVVPEQEWANIMQAYHDDPMAGHFGAEKTYARIAKRYFWRGMRKYIASYVKNCVACQRYKPSNMKPAGLLQTTAMNKRFEAISFDLFGPLPASPDGKTWILIVEDCASRWIELFALEQATAEACSEVLMNELFLRYGVPRRMTSDNGPQFVSAVMQIICFCFKISHSFTPVYHPEANPVERRNRDLKTMLAILVGDNHSSWPNQLASIRFALNSAVNASTGFSPAYLTFGRELRTPNDNENDLRDIILGENFIAEITPKLLQIASTLTKAREIQEGKEEKRKEYVDKHRRESPVYKPGDLVLADVHPVSKAAIGRSAKFAPRRDGPYIIVDRHGPASYKLANVDRPEVPIGTYHASTLRSFQAKGDSNCVPLQPLRRRGRPRIHIEEAREAPQSSERRGRGRPRKNPK